jgi:hypothetical protein
MSTKIYSQMDLYSNGKPGRSTGAALVYSSRDNSEAEILSHNGSVSLLYVSLISSFFYATRDNAKKREHIANTKEA